MAHSLSSISATANVTATISRSIRFSNTQCSYHRLPNPQARSNACNESEPSNLISRRNTALILTGVMLGVNVVDRSAEAAARRPPPPPPKEKKDPNLSGVQAKVLASKKRKEALKEATAKLRAKGKPVDQPPPE
ncbi:hypothetical protein IC582_023316 [Cucumis melo]|uniref:Uncharacterized protein LOC103488868 isoform X2 n=1 Tax=Cucumis melo TaxID=3656 RepID=A0A1S3BE14_CUCME|nr:uncharacterized protein LOC103488868 isoform X2 [Cucumis melo]